MIDTLIQHVLAEIAMDGDEGSVVNRLNKFIAAYFDQPTAPQTIAPRESVKPLQPKLDNDFYAFVWDTLLQQEGVRLILVEAIPGQEQVKYGNESDDAPEDEEGGENGNEEEPAAAGEAPESDDDQKPRSAAKAKGAILPTHTVRVLTEAESNLGKDELNEMYGDDLRMAVSAERTWEAITGSHARPSAITATVWRMLQFVSRSRGDGVTVVDIGHFMRVDQKSAYHYVNTAVKIGAVRKFRASTKGSWTNRILHVRYLDISADWAIFNASDDSTKVNQAAPVDSDSSDDEDRKGPRFTPIGEGHFNNPDLIRTRILKVLAMAPSSSMRHIKVAKAIGFIDTRRGIQRKLNSQIDALVKENKIEKINFQTRARHGAKRQVFHPGLRLVVSGLDQGPTEIEEKSESDDEDDEEDERRFASATLSIDRQVIDLLQEAGQDGLRNSEISAALGNYSVRSIDHLLNKLEKERGPLHLADLRIHTASETVGRQKNNRTFLLSHYIERTRMGGSEDHKAAALLVKPESIGGWQPLESVGFYADGIECATFNSQISLMTTSTQSATGAILKAKALADGKLKSKPKPRAPRVRTAKEGKEKKKVKEKKVKPAKDPNAPLTYYAKKKLLAAEREAQGLPPKEKRVGGGGRKSKATIAMEVDGSSRAGSVVKGENEKEEEDELEEVVAVVKKVTRGKGKAKAIEVEVEVEAEASDVESNTNAVASTSKAISTPTPPAKKRGRPRKSIPAPADSISTPVPDSSPVAPTPTSTRKRSRASAADTRSTKKRVVEEVVEEEVEEAEEIIEAVEAEAEVIEPVVEVEPPVAIASPPIPVLDVESPEPEEKPMPVKKPRGARKSGDGSRTNLTHQKRQHQLYAYIEAHGGIIEKSYRLLDLLKDWSTATYPDETVFRIDRPLMNSITQALIDRNLIKVVSTKLGNGADDRRDVLYLSSIDVGSPQMNKFISGLRPSGAQKGMTHASAALATIVIEDDDDDDQMGDATVVKSEVGEGEEESLEEVRARFLRLPKVVAAKYGLHYGRFARARTLHRFLVKYVQEESEATEEYVVSRDPLVFTKSLLFKVVPLGVYLNIVSIAVDSPELDEYLKDPAHLEIPLNKLPASIRKIIKPNHSKRHTAMFSTLITLMKLGLLQPLRATIGQNSEGAMELEESDTLSTAVSHWQINEIAPIYAYGEAKRHRLIAVVKVTTPVRCNNYWKRLWNASLVDRVQNVSPVIHDDFPDHTDQTSVFVKQVTSAVKWQEEYLLLDPQRKYLKSLLTRPVDPIDVDTMTSEDFEGLAYALLAPVERVEAALRKMKERLTAERVKAEGGAVPSKRRRVTAKDRAAASDHEEGEERRESGEEDEPTEVTVRKRAGKREQIEQVYNAILKRIQDQHAGIKFDPALLDFLRNAFTKLRINIPQLKFELRSLGGVALESEDAALVSIIDKAAREYARRSKDAYFLPDGPRPLPPARKNRAAPKPVVTPALPPPPDPDHPRTDDADQSEFLSAPIKPLPVDPNAVHVDEEEEEENDGEKKAGKKGRKAGPRLPRGFWTAEQTDLCIDATVVIKTRLEYLGAKRMFWKPLEKLFVGVNKAKLRQLSLRLTSKAEDAAYLDNLMLAWKVVYAMKRDSPEMREREGDGFEEFDIAAHVRVLRASVDKGSIRLSGPPPEAIPVDQNLPASIDELFSKFTIEEAPGATNYVTRWSSYYDGAIQSTIRETETASLPFAVESKKIEKEEGIDHQVLIAMAAMKMVVASPVHTFTTPQSLELIHQFDTSVVKAAVQLLVDRSVFAKYSKEAGRRLPGRNYFLSDRFMSCFESGELTSARAIEAEQGMKMIYSTAEKHHWSLMASDGDMMAFLHLVSDRLLTLEIDAASSENLRPLDDYETRKAVDEHIELNVEIAPKNLKSIPAMKPIRDLSNIIVFSDDVDELESTHASLVEKLGAARGKISKTIVKRLLKAGVEGVRLSDLIPEGSSRAQYVDIIGELTSTSPPLAFWAGHSYPALVSAVEYRGWTVMTRSPVVPSVAPANGAVVPTWKPDGKGTRKSVNNSKIAVDVITIAKPSKTANDGTIAEEPIAEEEDDDDVSEVRSERSASRGNPTEPEVERVVTDYNEPRATFPALWIDLEGGITESVWKLAIIWIKGVLMLHSGSTLEQIHQRAQETHLLTLTEIMSVLAAMRAVDVVFVRSTESAGDVDTSNRKRAIDWDGHWILAGVVV